jgi:alpha-N-arabinofuranosidase
MIVKRAFTGVVFLAILQLAVLKTVAQPVCEAEISIDLKISASPISPMFYGQFIEYLGRCIDGGIYDEKSALSDANGFRKDVLQKVQELRVPLLRFPGGTVIKTYHWQDGIGPKPERPKRKNLIWGGTSDNHFGTAEFVEYCRQIGAEPFLVINMSTGTPEEASNWVEYCNGDGDTYWANLRRQHGYEKPFNVKYWGIGNEEYAVPDAGKHQKVEKYIEDCWQYVKLMKLQDPSLKLTLVGNSTDMDWSKKVLDEMHPVCDFLSVHLYSIPSDSKYTTLLKNIDAFNADFNAMRTLLQQVPEKVANFSSWYRFPPRTEPVKLAVDEWGIWDINSGKGKGAYQLEYSYNWAQALAVGKFLNLFQRNADLVGLATWAQTVNVLAPIMTNEDGSYCQTVYTPLQAYRQFTQSNNLPVSLISPELEVKLNAVDATASISDDQKEIVVSALNLSEKEVIPLKINFSNLIQNKQLQLIEHISYTAPTLESANDFGKNCITETRNEITKSGKNGFEQKLKPASINFFRFRVF